MYNYMYTGCIYKIIGYAGISTVEILYYCDQDRWRTPLGPWIRSAEVRWNVVMRMGPQQLYNNQDRYVNEFVPPKTWTLPC